jgi:hypothetical protein
MAIRSRSNRHDRPGCIARPRRSPPLQLRDGKP